MITIPFFIPITIQPLFWVMALLIGWMNAKTIYGAILAAVVIFFSVLIHEFGHAFTSLIFKQKPRIELAAFGGFTYREGRKLRLWEEFFIVLNGPLAGFLLFAVAWIISQNVTITNPALAYMMQFTYMVNFFWTLLNLLPVMPLDGGHLLSILLQSIFGFKGIKIALVLGIIIGLSASLFFFALGAFLPGALFALLTFESIRSFRYYRMLTEKDRDEKLQELIKKAETDVQEGNMQDALAKFEKVRESTKKGVLFTLATEEMVQIFKEQNRFEEAYKLLRTLGSAISQEMLPLLHLLAFKNQDYPEVIRLHKDAYQLQPDYKTALLNALAFSAKGEVEPAIGWLECALRDGLPTLDDALKSKEFQSLKETPRFKEFLSKHKQ